MNPDKRNERLYNNAENVAQAIYGANITGYTTSSNNNEGGDGSLGRGHRHHHGGGGGGDSNCDDVDDVVDDDEGILGRDSCSRTGDATNPSDNSTTWATSNAVFPEKLFALLEDSEENGNDTIVSWNSNGRSFKVYDIDLFVSQVLPQYFKQTKYRSFQRQLNFWGFQRVSCRRSKRGEYFHPQFIRGQRALCNKLSRNPNENNELSRVNYITEKQESTVHDSDQIIASSSSPEQRKSNSEDESTLLPIKVKPLTKKKKQTSNDNMKEEEDKNDVLKMSPSSGLGDDQCLLEALLSEHSNDLLSLPAYKLCDVFNSSSSSSSDEDSSNDN